MELYLQFGHNMRPTCLELVRRWRGGTVILSPRDLDHSHLCRLATEVRAAGGRTLLDPQSYNPRADHKRLLQHDYWPKNFDTSLLADETFLGRWLTCLRELNDDAHTDAYILPGFYATRIDQLWIGSQEILVRATGKRFDDKPRLATICLSAEALRDEEEFELLLSRAESWPVDGYYVVAEPPSGRYLVDDPVWLANLLVLCAGLKLHGRQVVVGYSNHQQLCLGAANVDAIAAGTYKNVRSFSPHRFDMPDGGPSRRARWWYYCPQALSEFTPQFMDIAERSDILDHLRPDPTLDPSYATTLFTGASPSSTGYREAVAQQHYLHCLHGQVAQARRGTFEETLAYHLLLLNTAEQYLDYFHRHGVRGQDRDFADLLDVGRAALSVLDRERGFVLSRQWD